eukprot:CAMPEP_0180152346 /NCGR_PEP_ID=MMETSP0986-20121125/22735_1 /TAXON_ID=697907 /ORGANISM="non described non described, Strain CCMP2293" /LENGTH=168 /DNA_ID=CAMNT_0022099945 /DNA_START=133 /DNA_END=639 /DNA_ORIENTATION=-
MSRRVRPIEVAEISNGMAHPLWGRFSQTLPGRVHPLNCASQARGGLPPTNGRPNSAGRTQGSVPRWEGDGECLPVRARRSLGRASNGRANSDASTEPSSPSEKGGEECPGELQRFAASVGACDVKEEKESYRDSRPGRRWRPPIASYAQQVARVAVLDIHRRRKLQWG